MSIDSLRFSHSEQEFQPLGEWAKRLSIPARTLLHHGSQGDLRLFTLPPREFPPREVDYYSVHEDFVRNSASPLPYEAQPISMPEPGVMGLVLANEDCAALASGQKVEQAFFDVIIRKQGVWGNIIQPIAGRLGSKLRHDGWRIAAYKRITSAEQGAWDVHSPVVVKIAAVDIYARDVDVEAFIARLKSYQFIADVFLGDRIVEELPAYVSGKLREVIDANRLFWRNADGIDVPERQRRRGEVLKYLKEDFLGLCDKKTSPTSLLKFAASACDPALVPPSQQLLSTSVTPVMLALLTAAKTKKRY
jgi:hypothetical protein